MNPSFSLADFQHLKDSQPMRKQDLLSLTLWFSWAQFWNQWTKNSYNQLKFGVIPIFYPCRAMGQPWVGYWMRSLFFNLENFVVNDIYRRNCWFNILKEYFIRNIWSRFNYIHECLYFIKFFFTEIKQSHIF